MKTQAAMGCRSILQLAQGLSHSWSHHGQCLSVCQLLCDSILVLVVSGRIAMHRLLYF
jgi:hypothetical protein